jgi:succinate dehydrogenase / fumarate reductase iron-sulfur subunit
MSTITFNIKRFDGERTWNQEYQFERTVNTLLGCLNDIRETQDDSLCFTQACRHAICGSCAIQVNGEAYLACETQLDDLIDTFKTDYFYLEPLNNFPVVRDLVVSFDEKADKMKRVMPWMCEKAGREDHTQSEADYHKYVKATDCILCGVCASQCRELAYDDGTYLEPFILNKAFRFAADSRDSKHDERIVAVLDNQLWKCIHCEQCTSKCPKEIDVAEEISWLRREVMKMGKTDSMGARHAMVFRDSLTDAGILDEMKLALKTEGLYKTAKNRVPFAVRMVTSGKMNPLHHPHQINGIEDVRKLHELAAQREKEEA